MADNKTVRPEACWLPIRLKEFRTSARFPISQHSGFYFPPSVRRMGPLSFKKGASFHKINFFLALAFLRFHKMEEVQHIAFIPIDSHTEFYFPPARLL